MNKIFCDLILIKEQVQTEQVEKMIFDIKVLAEDVERKVNKLLEKFGEPDLQLREEIKQIEYKIVKNLEDCSDFDDDDSENQK